MVEMVPKERTSDDLTMFYMMIYVATGFLITTLMLILIYVACSKKYRLNWYEKNLLERRDEMKVELYNSKSSSLLSLNASMNDDGETSSQRSGSFIIPSTTNVIVSEETLPNHRLDKLSSHSRPSISDSMSSIPSETETSRSPTKPKTCTMQTKLDPSKINASLYQTIEENPSAHAKNAGLVHLILSYDITSAILNIRIVEVNNLPATELNGTANPYVKIKLLPHHTNVWQTRIHKKTLNPVFDEDFVFEVDPSDVQRHHVEVTLCDFVAYSRHRNIGTLKVPLSQVDLTQVTTLWKELKPCNERETKAELGDVLVSLVYLPSAERLTVTIVKARNLKIVDETRASSDPFVKVAIIVDGKRVKKQKTSVHRNTISPVFNEALTFKLGKEVFRRCAVEFRIFHDSLLGANSELLGTFIVGNETNYRIHDRQIHSQLLHDYAIPIQWVSLTDTY